MSNQSTFRGMIVRLMAACRQRLMVSLLAIYSFSNVGCYRLGLDDITLLEDAGDVDADIDGDTDSDFDGDEATNFVRLSIQSDLDDGELDTSEAWGDSGFAPQGEDACQTYCGGFDPAVRGGDGDTVAYFRFRLSNAITSSATVTTAQLRLYGLTTWNWRPVDHALSVFAELSTDAAQVTSVAEAPSKPSGRPVTFARLLWGAGGSGELDWSIDAWNESPDLSAVIQELIDRVGGLAIGAHVQLWLWRVDAVDNGEVGIEDFCHADGHHAQLDLEWIETT